MSFNIVKKFEESISDFFGSKFAVAVDSCTHGIELCLRYTKPHTIKVPNHTYLSIPFLSEKLNLHMEWSNEKWIDYYYLTDRVIDAAVLWRKDSYIPNTMMCLSFQYQKHLSLGRGGIVLLDNEKEYFILKKMSYDGRLPDIPWREQNIDTLGFHYYMTPETAALGLEKLPDAKTKKPRKWIYTDWPDLTQMEVFQKNKKNEYIYERTDKPDIIKRKKQGSYDDYEYYQINKIDPYLQTR